MLPTLRRKLEALADRRDELERLLADPAVAGDQDRFRALSREFSRLEPLATANRVVTVLGRPLARSAAP